MTIEQRASLLDEALLALLKDRAEVEKLNTEQAKMAREMGKGYY